MTNDASYDLEVTSLLNGAAIEKAEGATLREHTEGDLLNLLWFRVSWRAGFSIGGQLLAPKLGVLL